MWFRRDLRVHDNTALHEAARYADNGVIGVFIITPDQWTRHDEAPVKVRFWLDNLRELSGSLGRLNIPLLVQDTPTFKAVPQALADIAEQTQARAVYFNREYEVNERQRDKATTNHLAERGIEVHAFDDRVLLAPDAIATKDEQFYKVFSPYRRAWLARAKKKELAPLTQPRKQPTTSVQSTGIPETVSRFDTGVSRPDLWPAGEHAAQLRLKAFVEEKADAYDERRDIPAVNGTSLLSPYLAAGVLSPRQCLDAAIQANEGQLDTGCAGFTTWISELIWRDFYIHVLVGFPRVSMNQPFDLKTERVRWRRDPSDLAAWKEGSTGFPIVDAAMRQLKQTGWMHNRLRMVTAMFLTKHLLIDWRLGEQYFMQSLIDGDLAANNGGWQWSASTGTDAAPYFRIFNPYLQSKKFDPDGVFIKKFCPELSTLSEKALHDPVKLSSQRRSGVDYPPPIVDHKLARERALRAFRRLDKEN